MTYLLGTNVVSERTRPQPDERVRAWLRAHRVGETYLSVIALAELEQGILRLGETRRAVARTWAALTAQAISAGKPLGYADSLIAATALTHGLTVMTRNVADFEAAQVRVVNPWEGA